jgi:hypothetical protein
VPSAAAVDGIEFDRYRNPAWYHILREHPGDLIHWGEFGAFDREPARLVIHWFKRRRPGQVRGIPEVAPALPLYALLRRFTLATVSAAEVAALFAVLLKSNLPPDTDSDGDGITPFDTQELARGMMAALPDGYEAQQMKPDHPATTYDMFKRDHPARSPAASTCRSTSRPGTRRTTTIPPAGSTTRSTTARSGSTATTSSATSSTGSSPPGSPRPASWTPGPSPGSTPARLPRRRWFWDGFKHVDPEKEANAQGLRLANGTTTMDIECAEDGNDWREIARQRAVERAFHVGLGSPYPGDPAATAALEIQAAKGEGKRPTFDIVGYTGAVMSLEGFYSPVIVDLAGLKGPGPGDPRPPRPRHRRIVGQTDSVKIAKDVRLTGIITGDNADATRSSPRRRTASSGGPRSAPPSTAASSSTRARRPPSTAARSPGRW